MGRLAIAPGMPGGKMKEAAAMAQRIYIIEDDVALRTELAHVLELSGFAVGVYEGSWADTAARALAAEPDCIVLDLKLPGADGHSFLCSPPEPP